MSSALLASPWAHAGPAYQVTSLPGLPSNSPGAPPTGGAVAINDSGMTAGTGNLDQGLASFKGTRPVIWTPSGTVELGIFDTQGNSVTYPSLADINDAGDVVGLAEVFSGGVSKGTRAVRWAAGSKIPVELPAYSVSSTGRSISAATDINRGGDVVGYSIVYPIGTARRAILWRAAGGGPVALDSLGTGDSTTDIAVAINNAGLIVGTSGTYVYKAAMWLPGQTAVTALPDLGSASQALAVNEQGVIVGEARKANTSEGSRAVRWDTSGPTPVVTELGFIAGLPGDPTRGPAVYAKAINEAGDAVGYQQQYAADGTNLLRHALLWRAGTTEAIDLNSLIDPASGWVLEDASSINNLGQIVGTGLFDPDGAGPAAAEERPFRLDPVPEPAALLPLTLVGLGLRRRRRMR